MTKKFSIIEFFSSFRNVSFCSLILIFLFKLLFFSRFPNPTWVGSNASDNFTDTESRCESSLCFYEFLIPVLFFPTMQHRMQLIFAEKKIIFFSLRKKCFFPLSWEIFSHLCTNFPSLSFSLREQQERAFLILKELQFLKTSRSILDPLNSLNFVTLFRSDFGELVNRNNKKHYKI